MTKHNKITLSSFINRHVRNPILAVFALAYVLMTGYYVASLMDRAIHHIEFVAKDIEKEIKQQHVVMINTMRQAMIIRETSLSDQDKWTTLIKLLNINKSILGIYQVDDSSRVIQSYPQKSLLMGTRLPVSDLSSIDSPNIKYSRAIKDELTGEITVYLRSSEKDYDRFITSYVVPIESYLHSEESQQFIVSFVNGKEVLASSEPFILDSDFNFLMNVKENLVLSKTHKSSDYSIVLSKTKGYMLRIVLPIDTYGWSTVIYYPMNILFSEVWFSLLLLAIVICVLIGLSYWTSWRLKRVTEPISELSRGFGVYKLEAIPHLETDLIEVNLLNEGIDALNVNLIRRDLEMKEFVFMTAHDLQEPLRTITSYIELLKEDFNQNLPEEAEKLMDHIVGASDRLSRLVKGLLMLTGIENFGDKEEINLNRLIGNVLVSLEQIITEKNASIEVLELPHIFAYEHHVVTVFQNLIENSLKYSPSDVQINIGEQNGWIYVRDKGIGIDSDDFEEIFKPFVRLQSNAFYEGTGLGLPSVKRIANLNGWELKVDSAVGQGSTFWIKFK